MGHVRRHLSLQNVEISSFLVEVNAVAYLLKKYGK